MAKADINSISVEDMAFIDQCVERACPLVQCISRCDLALSLCYAHLAEPLHLERLLSSTDANFLHDIVGVVLHIDRNTGCLEDGFLPRFAVSNDYFSGTSG